MNIKIRLTLKRIRCIIISIIYLIERICLNMKKITYTPTGVCARQINIEINEDTNTVEDVSFVGGCNGNLKGIGSLVKGMKIEDVIEKLEGTNCNGKGTSCPDQLAKALKNL